MHSIGHTCVICHAYWLPLATGFFQILAWTAFAEHWRSEVLVALLFGPIVPIGVMYCMLRGSGIGDPLKMERGAPISTRVSRYKVGEVLKYISLGGIKKPAETGHHCDVVVGPPVAGLEVLEVMYGGYLRLLFTRQLFAESKAGGLSTILGPFESVTHSSVLGRDEMFEKEAGDEEDVHPQGVSSEFITTRHDPPLAYNEATAMNILLAPRGLSGGGGGGGVGHLRVEVENSGSSSSGSVHSVAVSNADAMSRSFPYPDGSGFSKGGNAVPTELGSSAQLSRITPVPAMVLTTPSDTDNRTANGSAEAKSVVPKIRRAVVMAD